MMGSLHLEYVTPDELRAALEPLEKRLALLEGRPPVNGEPGPGIPIKESGPITVTGDGHTVEGFRKITGGIKANNVKGLKLRNLYVEGIIGGSNILDLRGCPDVMIENVFVCIPSVTMRRLPREQRALYASRSDKMTIKRFMMRNTGSIKLDTSHESLFEEIVGFDMRCHALNSGGDQRGYSGQFIQWNMCNRPILQKFYNKNDLAVSSTVDNISVHATQNARIFEGQIDGNTDPAGVGIMFEEGSKGGFVRDVIVQRVCNGAFMCWDTSAAVFELARSRDHYRPAMESQVAKGADGRYSFTGNREPKSGAGLHFGGAPGSNARYKQALYHHTAGFPRQVAWDTGAIQEDDWDEEDFPVPAPLALTGWPFPT
jgi:hypothetical protein